jgi:hypothetical protein
VKLNHTHANHHSFISMPFPARQPFIPRAEHGYLAPILALRKVLCYAPGVILQLPMSTKKA